MKASPRVSVFAIAILVFAAMPALFFAGPGGCGGNECSKTDADGDGLTACDDCHDGDADITVTLDDPKCPSVGSCGRSDVVSSGCTSDDECKTAVGAVLSDSDALDATGCLTATGTCQTDCGLAANYDQCVTALCGIPFNCDEQGICTK